MKYCKKPLGLFLIFVAFFLFSPCPCPAQQAAGKDSCERALREASALSNSERHGEAEKVFGGLTDNPACPSEVKCEAYFGRGKIREKSQDLNGAILDFEKALQCRPQSYPFRAALANAYLKRGSLRERLGDLRGGPADYEKALQYESDLPEARASLSNIYYHWGLEKEKRGEWNGALDDYKKSLQYNQFNREASEAMSNLKEKKRNKSQERDGLFVF